MGAKFPHNANNAMIDGSARPFIGIKSSGDLPLDGVHAFIDNTGVFRSEPDMPLTLKPV
ncbi:MAG: hypothetical protein AAFQ58_00180 [Pseudomonadota bacterium]